MTFPWVPVLLGFAGIRAAIGLAPLVAPGPAARLLGFPASEDTASARVFGGLFGVRDVGLGAVAAYAAFTPAVLLPVLCLQAATDLGDLSVFLLAAARRPDLRVPLLRCAAVAGPAVGCWGALAALAASG